MGRPGRLPNYDYSSGGCYFVTFCTKDRKMLLSTIVGQGALALPKIQLTETGEILNRYICNISIAYPNVIVDKYIIMPNHVHMILTIEESYGGARAPRPTIMAVVGGIKSLTSRAVAESIWQTSFHDHVIRNEEDYLKIWNYIDANAVKWSEDCYYKEV